MNRENELSSRGERGGMLESRKHLSFWEVGEWERPAWFVFGLSFPAACSVPDLKGWVQEKGSFIVSEGLGNTTALARA